MTIQSTPACPVCGMEIFYLDGDITSQIKDLKVKCSSLVIKGSRKIKNIRLVVNDHILGYKANGPRNSLELEFLKNLHKFITMSP